MILQWPNSRKFLTNVKITCVWYKYLREKVVGGVWIFEVEKKSTQRLTIVSGEIFYLLIDRKCLFRILGSQINPQRGKSSRRLPTSQLKVLFKCTTTSHYIKIWFRRKKIKLSFSRNWLIQVVLSSIVLKYIWCIDFYGPKCNITLKRQYCSK